MTERTAMLTTETTCSPVPPPPPRYAPTEIAPDTFVVRATQGEGVAPVAVHLNTMVIRGSEPIVVDTGVPAFRDRYLDDIFSLVEPEDVRWVFLSHDDVDHYGNLEALMASCPNATLLTSWFQWERLGNLPSVAPHRMRWLAVDERFDINGRTYAAVRPPLYDSPTTRGLLDTATGVYWSSDCFATTVPHALDYVDELPEDEWVDACIGHAQLLSPWVAMVDRAMYHAEVERFARLDIRTIASCHSPTISADGIGRAIRTLHEVPTAPLRPSPGQELLDEIVAGSLAAAAS
jgi:flavorubredoxin